MFELWKLRPRLGQIKDLQLYLFIAVKKRCLNVLRTKYTLNTISIETLDSDKLGATEINPEMHILNSEMILKIDTAVKALPLRCKLVFELVKKQGLSYRETAAILEISEKTVDAHLVKAMRLIVHSVRLAYAL